MSNFQDPKAAEIVKRADELIGNVKRQLDAADEFFREQGLDPEKVRSVLEAELKPQQMEEAEASVRADLAAVEQEVAEEAARLSFAKTGSSAPKRPRSIV